MNSFSPLSQFVKPEPESRLISKYLIIGFSFKVIFKLFSLLDILMSEKSPVVKSDSIIPSLKALVYSCPTLKGINFKRDSSGALFSPIKLILLIGLEKDWVVKTRKEDKLEFLIYFSFFHL